MSSKEDIVRRRMGLDKRGLSPERSERNLDMNELSEPIMQRIKRSIINEGRTSDQAASDARLYEDTLRALNADIEEALRTARGAPRLPPSGEPLPERSEAEKRVRRKLGV